ncbi:MAG: metal-dependent hydrolase [Pseudomonadales bacterium]|nr:metal-dependent hydrolase [Pseudomonadales bacterium]
MALSNKKIGYDEVTVRDLKFNLTDTTVNTHWFNNDPWSSHFMTAVLAVVPEAERWVLRSAREQMVKISDPRIKKAARDFIHQERIHAREHGIMNDILIKKGLPIDRFEKGFKKRRLWFQSKLSVEMQGSIAASFEHFTAVLSSAFLENPDVFEDTDPEIVSFLYWHFVEETEHKSVSFDVFVEACNGRGRAYVTRAIGMFLGTAIGASLLFSNLYLLVKEDKQLLNVKSALSMAHCVLIRPAILSKMLYHTPRYFLPNFHPWDDDNRKIIQPWKKEYEKSRDTHKAFIALKSWVLDKNPEKDSEIDNTHFEKPVQAVS